MSELRDRLEVQKTVSRCLRLIHNYSWLINSYVLDFYVNNHWKTLPPNWQETLSVVEPEEFGNWLNNTSELTSCRRVWPLSLIAFRSASKYLSIDRCMKDGQVIDTSVLHCQRVISNINEHWANKEKINDNMVVLPGESYSTKFPDKIHHLKLQNIFRKHIKPKKFYEICQMAQVTADLAYNMNCLHIVDIGSGLGHFARTLSYSYGLKVCCIEAQIDLIHQAQKFDKEFERNLAKHLSDCQMSNLQRPVHLNENLHKDTNLSLLIQNIRKAFGESKQDFKFGIVGLHPCGDLGAILLDIFLKFPDVAFINIVSCCYMKLTMENESSSCFKGYPLSNFVLTIPHTLSYEAREIACHAMENYVLRLCQGNYSDLKVHCYRALLEKIIVQYRPELRHSPLKSIKHTKEKSFAEYCVAAVANLNFIVPLEDVESEEIKEKMSSWKKVVIFYTLRLMLAPVIETVILLDRWLYLEENEITVKISPVFDPKISPRNHVLVGLKGLQTYQKHSNRYTE